MRSLVLKECVAAGKKGGFKGIEILQGVVLTPEEWTPESGLVTAAQKIQRKKIEERYLKDIKVCYSSCPFNDTLILFVGGIQGSPGGLLMVLPFFSGFIYCFG